MEIQTGMQEYFPYKDYASPQVKKQRIVKLIMIKTVKTFRQLGKLSTYFA